MKYLLIALFIGTAYGQDTAVVPESISGYKLARVVYDTTWWYNLPKAKTREYKLAEHWENYKKSLDSTYWNEVVKSLRHYVNIGHSFEVYPEDGEAVFIKSNKVADEYIRRTKPTLDGFMKYLKELK